MNSKTIVFTLVLVVFVGGLLYQTKKNPPPAPSSAVEPLPTQDSSNEIEPKNSEEALIITFPVDSKKITQHFHEEHFGLDFTAPDGTNPDIVAVLDGTVQEVVLDSNEKSGNYVVLQHKNGVTTRYEHCKDIIVSVGDTVTQGQKIATMGSTGYTVGNGPVLHFGLSVDGIFVNPLLYIQ